MFNVITIKHIYILILLLVYATFFIVFHFKIKKDPELKAFFLDSLRENGKPSGKSLTGLFFVQIIGFATIIAIIYAPNHLLPEYFLISILTFVGGLYGMKVASKYVNTGGDSSNNSFNQNTSNNINNQNNSTTNNTNLSVNDSKYIDVVDSNKNNKNNPDDIG